MRGRRAFRSFCGGVLLACLAACAPHLDDDWSPPLAHGGALFAGQFITADGSPLPLRQWLPGETPLRGVIVALHGFNDNAGTYAEAGPWWASQGFAVYAYDQRGFGGAPTPGTWGGGPQMARDLLDLCHILRRRYPALPLVVIGTSMGGAVTLAAADMARQQGEPWADGLVLAAPAIWGRDSMPWIYRLSLAVMVRIAPSLELSGKGLNIWPTDNIEMLRGLSKDPTILRKTRTSAVFGLTNLMDRAAEVALAGQLRLPILWLYGARDEVIPPQPTFAAAQALLRHGGKQRLVVYGNGWHMLMRDLQSEQVFADVAAFVTAPDGALPFGRDVSLEGETFTTALPPLY
jgi:alpha-beta hydrolase superfamily lysophospholipase